MLSRKPIWTLNRALHRLLSSLKGPCSGSMVAFRTVMGGCWGNPMLDHKVWGRLCSKDTPNPSPMNLLPTTKHSLYVHYHRAVYAEPAKSVVMEVTDLRCVCSHRYTAIPSGVLVRCEKQTGQHRRRTSALPCQHPWQHLGVNQGTSTGIANLSFRRRFPERHFKPSWLTQKLRARGLKVMQLKVS